MSDNFDKHMQVEIPGDDGKKLLVDFRILGPKSFKWKNVNLSPKKVTKKVDDLGNGWTRTTQNEPFQVDYELEDD